MKVSIVIPVYNVEKYLRMCLDSVLAQEYSEFEAILVDDGSTDSSGEICEEYAEKDSRIMVVHQENGGLSNARNSGVKHANGDYIYFIDSDDCIHPQLLSMVVNLAVEKKADIVQIELENVTEDFSDYQKEILHRGKVFELSQLQAFYNIDRDNQGIAKDIRLTTTVVWTKLYKRELCVNNPFPENMRLHEDQMMTHRFIVQANKVIFCDCPLYYYRARPASLIKEGWTVKRLAIFDCYKDRVEWAKKVNGPEEKVKDLVYFVYIRYLTCMFKNYLMASRKLDGDEKEECRKNIMERFRREYVNRDFSLKMKDRMIFCFFKHFPNGLVKIYDILKK